MTLLRPVWVYHRSVICGSVEASAVAAASHDHADHTTAASTQHGGPKAIVVQTKAKHAINLHYTGPASAAVVLLEKMKLLIAVKFQIETK